VSTWNRLIVRAVEADVGGMKARGRQKWVHLVFTIIVVGLAASILITAALSKPPPGRCEGIGWGCNLYGGDAALLDAVFVVPMALALLVVGNVFIALAGRTLRKRANRRDKQPAAL
jgi:hypothetical protein